MVQRVFSNHTETRSISGKLCSTGKVTYLFLISGVLHLTLVTLVTFTVWTWSLFLGYWLFGSVLRMTRKTVVHLKSGFYSLVFFYLRMLGTFLSLPTVEWLIQVFLFVCSIHNLLTRSRSSSTDHDNSTNSVPYSHAQAKTPPHQGPPPPRHTASEGGSQTRFRRSDSAPPQPVMPMESLVVNLNQGRSLADNRNLTQGPTERSRFVPTAPLPPPPAPKSVCWIQSRSCPLLIVYGYF